MKRNELKRAHLHIVYLSAFLFVTIIVTLSLLVGFFILSEQRSSELEERIRNLEIGVSNLIVLSEDELNSSLESFLENGQISFDDEDISVSAEESRDVTVNPLPQPQLIIPTD